MSLERILEIQRAFYQDRPVMAEGNTKDFLKQALAQEAQELVDDVPDYMSQEQYEEQELADVLLFAFALADAMAEERGQTTEGLITSIVMEKIARNYLKYEAKTFQNGRTFEDAVAHSKTIWSVAKGNEEFYE